MGHLKSRLLKCGVAVALTMILIAGTASANNVAVSNVVLEAPGVGVVSINFDIAWDNSWRDGVNWDACWLFAKYSIDGGTTWGHAVLSGSGTNPASFSVGTNVNLELVVPADRVGAFLQRTGNGTGTVASTGVSLQWNFASNGVSRNAMARVNVYAVEMVYVPTAAFSLGSGGSEANHFYQYTDGSQNTNTFSVTSEAAIVMSSSSSGDLWATGNMPGSPNTLGASYPKGYGAFYCMKYEISQRQYSDFLNTLPALYQGFRSQSFLGNDSVKRSSASPSFFGSDANGNAGGNTSADTNKLNESNDGEWVGARCLGSDDLYSYAD